MEKWNDEKNWDIKEPVWRQAIDYAHNYHTKAGQYRISRSGEKIPYITHIQEVMRILINEANIKSYDILTVTALHDVLNGTDCTLENVRSDFGNYIAGAVDLLTIKENQSYDEYTKSIFTSKEYSWVGAIKLAERIHELRFFQDRKELKSKIGETRKYIQPYAKGASPILAEKLKDVIIDLSKTIEEEQEL